MKNDLNKVARKIEVDNRIPLRNYYRIADNLLRQDGKIEAEVKLTGILSLGALQPGETRKYSTTIAPGLYAPVHQHFFIARMDMSVDCKPGEALNQWNFRIGFTPREGLVIHSVAYVDGSRGRRHVAHRLSFVEMVVPYGDPNEPHDCVADFVNS